MSAMDLSAVLKKIRLRYPDWWRSEAAIRCLRQLWAGVRCNDSGVFEDCETIRIDVEGERQWYAEIRLAAAPNGWVAVATSYSYALGGAGSMPSVWDRTAFTSRDEAIEHGIKGLIASFERLGDSPHARETQVRNAGRMLDALRAYRHRAKQLTLF